MLLSALNRMRADFDGAYDRLKVTLRLDTSNDIHGKSNAPVEGSSAATTSSTSSTGPSSATAAAASSSAEPGKAPRPARALSGGERAVTALVTAVRPVSSEAGPGEVVVVVRLDPPESHTWALAALGQLHSSEALKAPDLKVVPVLFTLGVNEHQTVANTRGLTAAQTRINLKAVEKMKAYHQKCVECAGSGEAAVPTYLPKLLIRLEALVKGEAKARAKNVELLLASCVAAKLMHAARTTSCKSAKDRTSVFHTLEVGVCSASGNTSSASIMQKY